MECSEEKIQYIDKQIKNDHITMGTGLAIFSGGAAAGFNPPIVATGLTAMVKGVIDFANHTDDKEQCNHGLPPKVKDTSQPPQIER